MIKQKNGPKILFFDIETAPILGHVWGLWENNVGLNQIERDWFCLSWSAKWMDQDKVMYMDQSNAKNIEDDTKILKGIWTLLDEADVVVGQNSKAFDIKRLNARFIQCGLQPYSSVKHIDTCQIARSKFGFTSNKLEYLTNKLCKKYKKSKHKKYSGFELWKECLAGNKEAWKEMRDYNRLDVLALEELFFKIIPWDNSINFNLYTDECVNICKCGSKEFVKRGFFYTESSKFQRYKCKKCGAETRSKTNLFSKEKRESLRVKTK